MEFVFSFSWESRLCLREASWMVLLAVARWPPSRQGHGIKECCSQVGGVRSSRTLGVSPLARGKFSCFGRTQECPVLVPLTSEQGPEHLGWFSWPCSCKRSSAWFLKEPGRIRYICNLHSKQAVCNKYAGYIVFLALIHRFNNVLFFGNSSFSVGLEEEPKRNIVLESVLIFQNNTCARVVWPNLAIIS